MLPSLTHAGFATFSQERLEFLQFQADGRTDELRGCLKHIKGLPADTAQLDEEK